MPCCQRANCALNATPTKRMQMAPRRAQKGFIARSVTTLAMENCLEQPIKIVHQRIHKHFWVSQSKPLGAFLWLGQGFKSAVIKKSTSCWPTLWSMVLFEFSVFSWRRKEFGWKLQFGCHGKPEKCRLCLSSVRSNFPEMSFGLIKPAQSDCGCTEWILWIWRCDSFGNCHIFAHVNVAQKLALFVCTVCNHLSCRHTLWDFSLWIFSLVLFQWCVVFLFLLFLTVKWKNTISLRLKLKRAPFVGPQNWWGLGDGHWHSLSTLLVVDKWLHLCDHACVCVCLCGSSVKHQSHHKWRKKKNNMDLLTDDGRAIVFQSVRPTNNQQPTRQRKTRTTTPQKPSRFLWSTLNTF